MITPHLSGAICAQDVAVNLRRVQHLNVASPDLTCMQCMMFGGTQGQEGVVVAMGVECSESEADILTVLHTYTWTMQDCCLYGESSNCSR
jgi:hypothetical protein